MLKIIGYFQMMIWEGDHSTYLAAVLLAAIISIGPLLLQMNKVDCPHRETFSRFGGVSAPRVER